MLFQMNDLSSSNFSPVWWPHRGTHTICLGSRLLFYSKCTRFTVCLTYTHISLTVYINQWSFFPKKSNCSAFKLHSLEVKRFTILLVPSNWKSIQVAWSYPLKKSKSHSIQATGMRSKIHTCQPQTVLLIAPFWLENIRQWPTHNT